MCHEKPHTKHNKKKRKERKYNFLHFFLNVTAGAELVMFVEPERFSIMANG